MIGSDVAHTNVDKRRCDCSNGAAEINEMDFHFLYIELLTEKQSGRVLYVRVLRSGEKWMSEM